MKPILVRPQASPGAIGPTPRDLVEAPLRRPLWVAIPFVMIVAGAVAAALLTPKTFQSSTLILVESEKVPDSFVQPVMTDSMRQRLYTLKQEILSRTRLEKVVGELDPYPTLRGWPLSRLVEKMRSAITVKVLDDAFMVSYVHTDPTMAMKVTNRLAGLFIEQAAQSREAQSQDAYKFIEEQLESSRQELEKKEWSVREYKQRHMGTLPEQLQANLATLQRLQIEQQTLAQNLRAAQDRVSLLESLPPGATSTDPGADLAQLRAQLNVLRGRYTDEHPDVKAVRARIAALESGAVAVAPPREGRTSIAPVSALAQARLEVEGIKTRRDDNERRLVEFQARVELVPRTEQELATLTRDSQKLNENYLALLKKKLDARMAEELEKRWQRDHFKVLDPAHVPERPVYPNKLLFLTLGIVAGLVVGVGASVGVEFLDASIRHVGELEAVIPYPVIATLPHIVAGTGRGAGRLTA